VAYCPLSCYTRGEGGRLLNGNLTRHKESKKMDTIAQEQFVEDFLLVSENDRDIYTEYTSLVEREGVLRASEVIQEQFENWISQLADQEEERGNEYGSLLLKQLLIGWGSDSFYKIAKRFEAVK
jgi:hypothetical protein